MQRVLDLDLDAFAYGSEYWLSRDAPRLDPEEYPPWELDKVVAFLESQCLLSRPLPGFVVEHHGELFCRWRDAIDEGLLVPPFHVTHVDAHADLGQRDSGFIYLLTELLHQPLEARRKPKVGHDGLGDGNYLAFAIANRWISELTYAIGGRYEGLDDEVDYAWTPVDLLWLLFEDFDPETRTIRLPVLEARNLHEHPGSREHLKPLSLEPPVSFSWEECRHFVAAGPYDVICLAGSPAYTSKGSGCHLRRDPSPLHRREADGCIGRLLGHCVADDKEDAPHVTRRAMPHSNDPQSVHHPTTPCPRGRPYRVTPHAMQILASSSRAVGKPIAMPVAPRARSARPRELRPWLRARSARPNRTAARSKSWSSSR
jgi:hypothetical protein